MKKKPKAKRKAEAGPKSTNTKIKAIQGILASRRTYVA